MSEWFKRGVNDSNFCQINVKSFCSTGMWFFTNLLWNFSFTCNESFHGHVQKSPLRIPEDFIKLMLKIYQEKYSSFKRLFPQESADVSDAIMGTREILKGAKGCEYEILPLPSVLKLQERRAEIVTLLWTGKLNDEQPNYFGFEMIENKWKPKLQMIDDPFYSNPKTWIEGCGCKSICFDQKNRCKCQNSPGRGNTCSPFTCKSCKSSVIIKRYVR